MCLWRSNLSLLTNLKSPAIRHGPVQSDGPTLRCLEKAQLRHAWTHGAKRVARPYLVCHRELMMSCLKRLKHGLLCYATAVGDTYGSSNVSMRQLLSQFQGKRCK